MRVTTIKNPDLTWENTFPDFHSQLIKYRTTLSVLKAAGLSGSTLSTLSEELAKEYGFDPNSILTN